MATRLNAPSSLFVQLYDALPQGVWLLDPKGKTISLNPAMCRLLGRDKAEVVNRSAFELLSPEDSLVLRRQLAAGPSAAPAASDIVLRRPNGSRLVCAREVQPLRDGAGDHQGWITVWSDVTAQRRVEAALHTYEVASNATRDLICVIDDRGTVRMVNDAWCRAHRLPRTGVIGRSLLEIFPQATLPERQPAVLQAMRQRRLRTLTLRLDIADRGAADLRIDCIPFGDDLQDSRHCLLISRDVTAEEARLRAAVQASASNRAILDTFPGFIVAIERDLRYSYVNTAAAAWIGGAPQDLIGQPIQKWLPPAAFETLRRDVLRHQQAPGQPVLFEKEYQARNGLPAVRLQVTHVCGPMREDGGQTFYAFGVDRSTDATAARAVLERLAEQARGPLRALGTLSG